MEDGKTIHNAFSTATSAGDPGIETREVAPGFVADLDAAGGVVGLDLDGASSKLDLSTLEAVDLPLKSKQGA